MNRELQDTDTQRRIATLIDSIEVSAPTSLHSSVRELTARAPSRRSSWGDRPAGALRPALLAGAGAVACAALLGIVLLLGAGGPTAPTVLEAAVPALRPATQNPPEEDPHAPGRLEISADGIAYPYWNRRFGWQTTGARTDRIGGRRVTTVFYTGASAASAPGRRPGHTQQFAPAASGRIGYSIVAGPALAVPHKGWSAVWHGVRFQVLRSGGATVVTWRRDGHTCILVGAQVSSRTLLTLANWQVT